VLPTNTLVERTVNRQLLLNKEFVTRFNAPDGFDEHPSPIFNSLTVRRACVVKLSRTVAAATRRTR